MANDVAIIAKMRLSQVPPHTYTTSLEREGQKRLSEILEGRKYEHAGQLRSYLVRQGARKKPASVSRVCALAAKQLVLASRAVYYTNLAEAVTATRVLAGNVPAASVYNNSGGDTHPILSRLGKGYIVVGDLGANIPHWPDNDWDVVQSFLLSHLSRGGGLILGDNGATANGFFCEDFVDALSDFVVIDVE
jgi:hypothetical protein